MLLRPGWIGLLVFAGWFLLSAALARADDPTPPNPAEEAPSPEAAPETSAPKPPAPEPLVLEEAPEILPAAPPSEEKRDRVHAATLFAQGRILNQRGKYADALAKYERAWRYDPAAKMILEELVPLALRINRAGEAARYAVIAIEQGAEIDTRTLQRLAMELSQNQEWREALVVYQKLYDLQKAGQGEDAQPDVSAVLVRLELGRIHFLVGDFKASAEAFTLVRDAIENPDKYHLNDALRKMVLDDPERTYMLLGEAFLRGGKPDDAEAMFRKADAERPQPEVLAFRLARVAHERGQPDEALKHLETYFSSQSSLAGSEPYELLAEVLAKRHGEDEAKKQLLQRVEKLHADDPANPGLAYFLAEQYLQAGRLDEAEKLFREQLTANPMLEGFRGLIAINREQDQPDELLQTLGQAAEADGSLDAYPDEVAELAKDEKLLDRLLEAARQKQRQGPDALTDGMALAAALVALEGKRMDAANEFFEIAAQRENPGPAAVLTAWGLGLFFNQESEKAAEVFQRALDENVNPDNNAAYYFYLANALAFAKRPDEAIAAALQAQQLRPENPRFESRLAWINYHAHRHGEAERRYLDLLEKIGEDYSSEDMRQLVREVKLILSNICVHQDRFDDGVEWLEQVLDEFPRDPGALNDLGYLWSEKGVHLERALSMVRQAVEAEPDNAAYQDSLGWALFQKGRFEEALQHLEKAVELQGDSPDGVILDHLGDAYLKLDQKDKALDAWRRAAAAFEEADEIESRDATRKKVEAHEP